MAKITKYVLILSITLLLYHMGGLIQNTPISLLLGFLLDPSSLINSSLYTVLTAAIAAASAAGVIVGSFVTSRTEIVLKASIVSFMILILWDFIAIYNVLKQTNEYIALLIISPLLLVGLITTFEWWFGRD